MVAEAESRERTGLMYQGRRRLHARARPHDSSVNGDIRRYDGICRPLCIRVLGNGVERCLQLCNRPRIGHAARLGNCYEISSGGPQTPACSGWVSGVETHERPGDVEVASHQ